MVETLNMKTILRWLVSAGVLLGAGWVGQAQPVTPPVATTTYTRSLLTKTNAEDARNWLGLSGTNGAVSSTNLSVYGTLTVSGNTNIVANGSNGLITAAAVRILTNYPVASNSLVWSDWVANVVATNMAGVRTNGWDAVGFNTPYDSWWSDGPDPWWIFERRPDDGITGPVLYMGPGDYLNAIALVTGLNTATNGRDPRIALNVGTNGWLFYQTNLVDNFTNVLLQHNAHGKIWLGKTNNSSVVTVRGDAVTTGTNYGNAYGMTNFSRAALAASGAVTNGQSSFTAGTVVASGAGFIGDASSVTNVPSLSNGTKSFYFDNPNTWRTPQDLGGSNITALGGTFTGNGSGLTNLNLNGYGITNAIISGTSYSGTGTNLSGRMHTGGHAETNFSTGSWSLLSNANFTLGGSNALGITLNGSSGSQTNTGTIAASNFVGVARVILGSASYQLTDNTQKYLAMSGTLASAAEDFARAPLAIGGTFGQLYFSAAALGAGTNVTVKIYTNGVYCGLGVTVRGTGSSVATNELVTTTGVVPAGAEVSLGLQSNYNGVHPSVYWKWSWVATR